MDRRNFITLMITYAVIRNIPVGYANELNSFRQGLKTFTLENVLDSKQYIEPEAATVFQVETQGQLKGARSDLKISEDAISLIVAAEVSSESNYKRKLIRPIWPKGHSGATIAIGFDIGQGKADTVRGAWENYLPKETIDELVKCAEKTGQQGKICTKSIQHVVVPWDAAMSQFRYYLPFVVAQTQAAFDNFELLTPDSRGALVSLVYNRGPDVSLRNRREEMYNIAQLMVDRNFSKIPSQIREMKKIWTKKDQRGLLIRRELEAQLFEIGLGKL